MQIHNWFVLVLVCSLVYFCNGEEECINADEDGTSIERCPENTFVYMPGCDNETMSQRTCRHPAARSLGYYCDYSRCECHEPRLWDEAANKCVLLEECSDQSKLVEEEEKLRKEQEKMSYRPYVDTDFFEYV